MKKLLSYLMTLVLALSIGFSGTAIYANINDYVVPEGGGNASLSAPYELLAKYEWSGGSYTLDSSNLGITIVSGSTTLVSFTSTVPVFAVIVKGGSGYVVETFEGVMSGSFTNENLSNNNAPGISNIKFYTREDVEDEDDEDVDDEDDEDVDDEDDEDVDDEDDEDVDDEDDEDVDDEDDEDVDDEDDEDETEIVDENPTPPASNPPTTTTPPASQTEPVTQPEEEETEVTTLVILEEDPIPEAAPVAEVVEEEPEEDPEAYLDFEILDEGLPQDVPEMPQTSGVPALIYILSGSALSGAGILFKKKF